MGFYESLDRIAFHGLLPGGAPPLGVGGGPQPTGTALSIPGAPGLTAAPGAAAPPPTLRGKILTVIFRVVPGYVPQVLKVTPGGVAVYQRDFAAAKRVRKLARKARPRTYAKRKR